MNHIKNQQTGKERGEVCDPSDIIPEYVWKKLREKLSRMNAKKCTSQERSVSDHPGTQHSGTQHSSEQQVVGLVDNSDDVPLLCLKYFRFLNDHSKRYVTHIQLSIYLFIIADIDAFILFSGI